MKKLVTIILLLFTLCISVNVLAYDISKDDKLYVSGESIGIKLNCGIEIVGTFGITKDNKVYKPWEESGITEGDKLTSFNGKTIEKTNDLLALLAQSNGKKSNITFIRNNKEYSSTITPVEKNNQYTLGLYIKDSILGVGTLTYYIKEANVFGSLGHKITNEDFYTGEIYEASVNSIVKPERNQAGEKKATISGNKIGTVIENTITGVHGNGSSKININEMEYLNFKTRDEINLGPAEIWTCISNDKVERFDIEITALEKQSSKAIKGITFKVVDEELIKSCGGIVQGMSGSPIVQDNKLIGAVTHVSIKEPVNAYGIYIEWMFEDMGITVVK
ncbi:MAG: PDZ domain-containing protein [Erysipelotrichaceae bacterium]|nr:PDZ domain-containing protein [Erysipelotrichaceae bacterium]